MIVISILTVVVVVTDSETLNRAAKLPYNHVRHVLFYIVSVNFQKALSLGFKTGVKKVERTEVEAGLHVEN